MRKTFSRHTTGGNKNDQLTLVSYVTKQEFDLTFQGTGCFEIV